jgi:hypothetical protein
MAKNYNGSDRKRDENVNDPGYRDDENIYQRKNEEEAKKIPVEYIGYVRRRHSSVVIRTLIIWIVVIGVVGFGPGMSGKEICPQCGRTRSYTSLIYGRWEFRGLMPVDTEWTKWYEQQSPLMHEHHWVQFGKLQPSLFSSITLPLEYGTAWDMPDNLVTRMQEITPMFRPGKINDIPKVLHAVNNAAEWRAIIMPLCMGTPQESFQWWQQNQMELFRWSSKPDGVALPEEFINRSEEYIKEKTPKDEMALSG